MKFKFVYKETGKPVDWEYLYIDRDGKVYINSGEDSWFTERKDIVPRNDIEAILDLETPTREETHE